MVSLALVLGGPLAHAIHGGSTTSDHPGVGALVVQADGEAPGFLCSATVVAPRYALTTAGCATLAEAQAQPARVCTGERLDGTEACTRVAELHPHPDYDLTTGDDDIALLELDAELPLSSVVPLYPRAADDLDSAELTFVGWGESASGLGNGGVKRSAALEVSSVDAGRVYAFDPDGERAVCAGDAGGAALVTMGRSPSSSRSPPGSRARALRAAKATR